MTKEHLESVYLRQDHLVDKMPYVGLLTIVEWNI